MPIGSASTIAESTLCNQWSFVRRKDDSGGKIFDVGAVLTPLRARRGAAHRLVFGDESLFDLSKKIVRY